MSGVRRGNRGTTSLIARGVGALFTVVIVVALLAVPRPAAAHEGFCAELWNPHGQTTPPAGFTTAPGTNPNSGQNPDGFYQVGSCLFAGTLVCPTGLGGPEFASACFCAFVDETPVPSLEESVFLFDGCPGTGDGGTGFEYDGNPAEEGIQPFAFGTVVKFTEANGKTPAQELMAGSKTGNPSSDAVEWHLWGEGDLLVCPSGDLNACVCCKVPPPPK